ncbi:Clr5 domain-containing protein [Xylaria digitata]|nr:Clr5 domain-containing protein [Xylaria digitata]
MQSSVSRSEPDGAAEHGQVRYAKPSEWAAQKDIIKRLYLDENKTLDEVRRIMAGEHQFHATPSMYKKRIRAWHFSKKLEEDDVLEVLQQKLERKAAGESSYNLVVRGRIVRNQRLRRFLERRPDVLARHQTHSDSGSSIGSSPSSSYGAPLEIPRVRALSPESRDMEQTLSAVRDYVRSPLWIADGSGAPRRVEIIDLRALRANMLQAVDEFYLLQASIDNKKPPKVIFQLLNSTLNRLSSAIRAELPDFFFQMIEIFEHPWSNYPELSQIFRRHVAELAVVHLGRNHPMSVLWIHLLRKDNINSNRVPEEVLELLVQELLLYKGPQDHLTCAALDYLLRFLVHTRGPFESYKRFKRWLDTYPGWDDEVEWSNAVRSKLQDSDAETPDMKKTNISTVLATRRIISAAIEYQRPAGPPYGDFHSAYLLPYLAGRISVRNGDAERAESLFLKAKAAARQARHQFHLVDYYVKVYTNLHVLYVATKQEKKLAALHEELAAFKANLPPETKLPEVNIPHDCSRCSDCV